MRLILSRRGRTKAGADCVLHTLPTIRSAGTPGFVQGRVDDDYRQCASLTARSVGACNCFEGRVDENRYNMQCTMVRH